MTNFDVLDKYNENFTTLSNEELAETNWWYSSEES